MPSISKDPQGQPNNNQHWLVDFTNHPEYDGTLADQLQEAMDFLTIQMSPDTSPRKISSIYYMLRAFRDAIKNAEPAICEDYTLPNS